jgi:hypothetical protein
MLFACDSGIYLTFGLQRSFTGTAVLGWCGLAYKFLSQAGIFIGLIVGLDGIQCEYANDGSRNGAQIFLLGGRDSSSSLAV